MTLELKEFSTFGLLYLLAFQARPFPDQRKYLLMVLRHMATQSGQPSKLVKYQKVLFRFE